MERSMRSLRFLLALPLLGALCACGGDEPPGGKGKDASVKPPSSGNKTLGSKDNPKPDLPDPSLQGY
jgi:hypothetical protein